MHPTQASSSNAKGHPKELKFLNYQKWIYSDSTLC